MGRATAGLIAWPRPILLCARRGQRPESPALRLARGPDVSGAVLLPSTRRADPLARIGPHCWNAIGTGVPARRLALRRDQKKGGKNVGERNTTRNPMLLLRLSGLFLLR